MKTRTILPLLLLLMTAAATTAQQAPVPTAAPAAPPEQDIVVQHRTDAAIARMVEAMTQTPHGVQVPRWNEAICPRVLDLDDVHAALIEDRIMAVAKSLDIAVAARPCKPTIAIIASPDANALAKALVERHPALFGDPKYGIRHGAALTELEASRPVRWIGATRTGNADGSRILPADASPTGFDTTYGYSGGSHIRRQTRENIILSLVILDNRQLGHVTWGQLADYLALVTLAHPRLTANAPNSVLSIFEARDAGGRGPAGLTPTDMALLQGLYRSNDALDAEMQRSQIADQVRKSGK